MALDRSSMVDCHDDGEPCDERGDHLDRRCAHGLVIKEFYSVHLEHDAAVLRAGVLSQEYPPPCV